MSLSPQILGLETNGTNSEVVTISVSGLLYLTSAFLELCPIDEKAYLADYGDVKVAIKDGTIKSATEHYLKFGLLEGRIALPRKFNNKAYLKANPDLADLRKLGTSLDIRRHYMEHGFREGRQLV